MFVNDIIKKEIIKAVNSACKNIKGFKRLEANEDMLEIPPDQRMGDFSLPCFLFSKQIGKSPNYIADTLQPEVYKNIQKSDFLKTVGNVGPYLNFFVKTEEINKFILNKIKKEKNRYGESEKKKKDLVMLEFSQPNTHKEFHIGHLRTTFLGDSLIRILRSQGNKVIAATYFGDTGVHVSKCLWGLFKWYTDEKGNLKGLSKIKNKGAFLGEVYSRASRLFKESEEVRKEVADLHHKLLKGDKKLTALWKETRKWSLDEFADIYKELGVKFDQIFYESVEEKESMKLLPKLMKEEFVRESQGAIIADLTKYNLDVLVLRKTDGTILYGLKDLPLGIKKYKKFKVKKSIYVIDSRQSHYIKQIFKILDLLGIKNEKIQVAYEFITLEHGAMSSREGNVVPYEFLRDKLVEKAKAETKLRHTDWKGKKIEEVAKKVAIAAMKFDILRQGNNKMIIFSIERSLRFSGCTGPYLLYTYARINSILKKVKKMDQFGKVDYNALKKDQEIALIRQLALFNSFLENAAINYNPSDLANYLYNLAKSFSLFYQEIPILKAEDKERNARLLLIYCISLVLKRGLELLGIEVVEEM